MDAGGCALLCCSIDYGTSYSNASVTWPVNVSEAVKEVKKEGANM